MFKHLLARINELETAINKSVMAHQSLIGHYEEAKHILAIAQEYDKSLKEGTANQEEVKTADAAV